METYQLLTLLIVLPLIPALFSALLPPGKAQNMVIVAGALAFGGAALGLGIWYWTSGAGLLLFPFEAPGLDLGLLALETLLLGFLFVRSLSMGSRGGWVPVLLAAQIGAALWLELSGALPKAVNPLALDHLSVLLLVVAGVVGALVTLYAGSYMQEEHAHHPERPDRRSLFFFLIFLFLSAMAGIALANSLTWLLFFWEITTLCSYLLIRYRGDEASLKNSDLALALNVLGGAFFTAGLLWLALAPGPKTSEVHALLAAGRAALPVAVLLGLAGLVKAAQLPFHRWLLGAMVAPTPVSALLHASTMVKAGVFILLRFSPIYQGTLSGELIALVGAYSFLLASILAVRESDAKRVLAWSTIANLGLIVTCAGIGGHDALWAGLLLLLFHAIAKGLLFLAVGTAEHRLGSRDIDDMHGLLQRQRGLGSLMVIGILGMFLAPFGMLTAKWKVLEALAESAPLVAILVAFGSAPTLFFWAKWLGTLLAIRPKPLPVMPASPSPQRTAMVALAALTIAAALAFPVLSAWLVEPHLVRLFPGSPALDLWPLAAVLVLAIAMLGLPLFFAASPSRALRQTPYMAGADAPGGFVNSLHQPQELRLRNYYLESVIDADVLGRFALWGGMALIIMAALAGVLA